MGREIRRVPPNWQHPKKEFCRLIAGRYTMVEDYQPLYKSDFTEAMHEWYAEWNKWEAGDRDPDAPAGMRYHEWADGPPDPYYYQHGIKSEDCTWFQLYETVSEGTPVSPPFATKEELADYLAVNGDFWDQLRVKEGRNDGRPAAWGKEAAERFCKVGFAPSAMLADGKMHTARDMP